MKLSVPIYNQRDGRWSSKKLGTSNTTIGNYGCVITSMAMLASYYGKTTDPAILNDETVKVKGFVSGNIYVWQSISSIYPDIKNTAIRNYPTSPAPIDSINNQLDNGKPVVVWLDLNPNQLGADHFSLLVGREGNDYWLNDTWYGDQVLFSTRYGDPIKYIFGHRFYSGQVPQVTIPSIDPLDECKKQVEDEIKKKNETFQELVETRTELEAAQSEIASHKNFQTQLAVTLKTDDQPTSILGQITKLLSEEDQLRQTLADNQTLKLSEANLTAEMAQLTEKADNLTLTNNAQAKSLQEAKDTIFQLNAKLGLLNQEYDPLFSIFGLIICKRKGRD